MKIRTHQTTRRGAAVALVVALGAGGTQSAAASTLTATNPYQLAEVRAGQATAFRDSTSSGYHLGFDLSASCPQLDCITRGPAPSARGVATVGNLFGIHRSSTATITARVDVTRLETAGLEVEQLGTRTKLELSLADDFNPDCTTRVTTPGSYTLTCSLTGLTTRYLPGQVFAEGMVSDRTPDGEPMKLSARAVVRHISVTTGGGR